MPVNTTVQVRRGTAALWASTNPVLAAGELGWDTTNNLLKVGDGVTAWLSLGAQNAARNLYFATHYQ